ncbi:unnamed protein product, partial [Rotaria sordida]
MSQCEEKTDYKVIVARYNESVDWVHEWFGKANVVVYNKGPILVDKDYEVISLPNIGRESHTYLQFVIDNYDNLPEICFFTQCNLDHFDDFVARKEEIKDMFINIDKCSKNTKDDYLGEGLTDGRMESWK